MDYPGATLGERHQVDFEIAALAFLSPGQGPARRLALVADDAAPAKLLGVDFIHLLADQPIEIDQELVEAFSIVVNPPLEIEIGSGDRHFGS